MNSAEKLSLHVAKQCDLLELVPFSMVGSTEGKGQATDHRKPLQNFKSCYDIIWWSDVHCHIW